MFELLTLKSQILVNALLASEAAFWMHNTNALLILCSFALLILCTINIMFTINIFAFAFSKWVRDQVVKMFQDCASVVKT